MDFSLTPEQEQLCEGARDLASRFSEDYWLEHDVNHEFPWEFYNAFADGGWIGMAIPEEYGGGGLGVTEASLVLQEIAASGGGMNACSSVHISIFGLLPVLRHGSEEMRRRFAPKLATGDLHLSFAITEPDAGTDTSRISTFAKRVDGGFLVSGKKVWITKAQEADRLVLLARTTPREQCERGVDGMTLFFAEVDRTRIDIRPIEKLGRNAVDTNELFIDELFVPDEDVIGDVDNGFRCLLDGFNPERILVAHEAVGLGRAALRRAVDYAKERIVFDRPIGMNQAVQLPLAESLIELDAAELVARKAAWLYDNGMPCGRESNAAKFLCSNAGFKAADRAIQTHGGFGYAKEYHVERYFREARLLRFAPLANELVLAYIGEHVLKLPRSY